MKKVSILFIIVTFLLAKNYLKADIDCWDNQDPCTGWTQSSYTYYLDGYNCPMTIYYEWQKCGDVTNFQLIAISVSLDAADDCNDLIQYLVPNGDGSYANVELLATIWKDAYQAITEQRFISDRDYAALYPYPVDNDEPSDYNCWEMENGQKTGRKKFKTVTKGGCSSFFTVFKVDPVTMEVTYRLLPASCDGESCCVTVRTICWDAGQLLVTQETHEMPSTDCPSKQPIENPLENYGPEWYRAGHSICSATCYIWAM